MIGFTFCLCNSNTAYEVYHFIFENLRKRLNSIGDDYLNIRPFFIPIGTQKKIIPNVFGCNKIMFFYFWEKLSVSWIII